MRGLVTSLRKATMLGHGRPMLGSGTRLPEPTRFRVLTSRVFEDGVAFVKYSRIR